MEKHPPVYERSSRRLRTGVVLGSLGLVLSGCSVEEANPNPSKQEVYCNSEELTSVQHSKEQICSVDDMEGLQEALAKNPTIDRAVVYFTDEESRSAVNDYVSGWEYTQSYAEFINDVQSETDMDVKQTDVSRYVVDGVQAGSVVLER